jgi:hypothetical protein
MLLIASSQSGEDSKERNGTPEILNGEHLSSIVEVS